MELSFIYIGLVIAVFATLSMAISGIGLTCDSTQSFLWIAIIIQGLVALGGLYLLYLGFIM